MRWNDFLGRAYRRVRDEFFPPRHPFDQWSGADTSGRIDLLRLGVNSRNRKHGQLYQAVEPGRFSAALAEIHEDFSTYTFVDLGAGKGRALMLAKEMRFGRLIGVEFSARLTKIARANLAKVNAKNAEIIVHDAAEFLFPQEPLVIFMFNPFGPEVLTRVLQNLHSHPGPFYLVYVNPLHDATIRENRFLRPLVTCELHSVWHFDSKNAVEAVNGVKAALRARHECFRR